MQVEGGAVEIADGIVHPTDTIPSFPDLQESFLHQILSLDAITREEPEGREEPRGLVSDELLEGTGAPEVDDRSRPLLAWLAHHVTMNPSLRRSDYAVIASICVVATIANSCSRTASDVAG